MPGILAKNFDRSPATNLEQIPGRNLVMNMEPIPTCIEMTCLKTHAYESF